MSENLTVNQIRKQKNRFRGRTKDVVAFLLKEVDDARRSAMGYGAVTIAEDICPAIECEDIIQWKGEALEAGDEGKLPPGHERIPASYEQAVEENDDWEDDEEDD